MTIRQAFEREAPALSFLLADPAHAELISDMHVDAFDKGWGVDAIEPLLAADTAIAFYATSDAGRKPVGFVVGRLAGDDAEIVTIGTRPEHQRRGIGTGLLAAFERAAERAGAGRVVFEVADDNTAARALYANGGYAEIGRRRDYYETAQGARGDALLLGKVLGNPASER
ncbi:MAG: GNAT family N-acetyltransferase [Pseudomonadota bacterium]